MDSKKIKIQGDKKKRSPPIKLIFEGQQKLPSEMRGKKVVEVEVEQRGGEAPAAKACSCGHK